MAAESNAVAVANTEVIDGATLAEWSAPFRNWHYWPTHVIPPNPPLPGATNVQGTDVPTVFQVPGDDKWYMSFVAFNGRGYQSYVAESTNLLDWVNYRLAMGYGPTNQFDHGGCVIGAYLYESYDLKAPRVLKKRDGKFWTLYGAYPLQGGYELRPGSEGVAASDDGLKWRRAKDEPVLSIQDPDCADWERNCIYQPRTDWDRFLDGSDELDAIPGQPGDSHSARRVRFKFLFRSEGVPGRRPLDDDLFRRRQGRGAHHDCLLTRPGALDGGS